MEESRTAMEVICDVVRFLSATSLGLFAGSMLTEGCILVPYWRSLPSAEFFSWYGANNERLLGFFGPLTAVTALLAVAAAVASLWQHHPGRLPALVAAALSVACVVMFPLYFQRVNAGFAASSISAEELPTALARWAAWHSIRVGVSIAALAAALLSLWR